jgi:hypothetical protein
VPRAAPPEEWIMSGRQLGSALGTLVAVVAVAALAGGAGCGASGAVPACGTDDQCALTQYCDEGACVPGCLGDADCPSGTCGAHGRCGPLQRDAGVDGPAADASLPQADAAPPEDAAPSDAAQSDAAPSDAAQSDAPACPTPDTRCQGGAFQTCTDGVWDQGVPCAVLCDNTLGCIDCTPDQDYCVGDVLYACTSDGHQGAQVKNCGAGMCKVNACVDPCAVAAGNQTYIGCDYWATVTMNSQLASGFSYALVVANTGDQAATVSVTGGELTSPLSQTIAAGTLATIPLPWVSALKETFQSETSVLALNKGYHLTSTLPVVVYQFNALEFEINRTSTSCSSYLDCPGSAPDCVAGKCSTASYTNDASLILPSHVLGERYLVMSRAPLAIRRTAYEGCFLFWSSCGSDTYLRSPGFVTVVATASGTTTVDVTFAGNAVAVSGVSTNYGKGQTGHFTLSQGDVLQLASAAPATCSGDHCEGDCGACETRYCYCDLSADYDLTGSEIVTSQHVAVFSGHNCDFAPYYYWACDHLEEELFPVATWGKRYVAARADPGNHPNLYRVLSAEDGNTITVTPATAGPFTVNAGKYVEFSATGSVEVAGTAPFSLAQFMVGQNYGDNSGAGAGTGDPSMSLAVPVEQYRTDYIFLAPATYTQNYVTFVAPAGATVTLDSAAVAGWTAVGTGDYQTATVAIAPGSHRATSTTPFGIASHGVAPYTSYMYPGGLNLVAQ